MAYAAASLLALTLAAGATGAAASQTQASVPAGEHWLIERADYLRMREDCPPDHAAVRRAPRYPAALLRRGSLSATVDLLYDVNAEGELENVRPAYVQIRDARPELTEDELDLMIEAAAAGLSRWEFKPEAHSNCYVPMSFEVMR